MQEQILLHMEADRALFQGNIGSLIVTFYENERPLAGLSGLLDWRFHGAISSFISSGVFTGAIGQCVYLPMVAHNVTLHLLFVGAGSSGSYGKRGHVPAETMRILKKNLSSLKLPKTGISRSDFGNASDDYFATNLKEVPLWIVQ